MVRVLYGVGTGFGLGGFDGTPLTGNILALHGELIPQRSLPNVMVLPPKAFVQDKVREPGEEEFELTRKDGSKAYQRTWFKAKECNSKTKIGRFFPIPAHLVYNGIETELDTLIVYERMMARWYDEDCKCRVALDYGIRALRHCLCSYTAKCNQMKLDSEHFIMSPHQDAIAWRDQRLEQLFPDVGISNTVSFAMPEVPSTPACKTPGVVPVSSTSSLTPPSAQVPAQKMSLSEELLARVLDKLSNASAAAPAPSIPMLSDVATVTSDSASSVGSTEKQSTLGLDDLVFDKLLTMCGLTQSKAEEVPDLWKRLASKNLSKVDKYDVIRAAIQPKTLHHRGAKIPAVQSIITMIKDRAFEGEYSSSSLTSTVKGLTPFAVPHLSESQVDAFNEQHRALQEATATTPDQVSALKLKATCPIFFESVKKQLKRFANLIFVLFGPCSPWLCALDDCIDELEEYNDTEIEQMSCKSFASILWIVHLQSRHFAAGDMKGDNGILPCFVAMMTNIRNRVPIVHGGVPPSLYINTAGGGSNSGMGNSSGRKRENDGQPLVDTEQNNNAKRQKGLRSFEADRADIYNPEMKKAMAKFKAAQKRPTVKQLCMACKVSPSELFPNDNKICIRSQLYGVCDAKCPHGHSKLSSADISKALEKLKPVIDKPGLVLSKV